MLSPKERFERNVIGQDLSCSVCLTYEQLTDIASEDYFPNSCLSKYKKILSNVLDELDSIKNTSSFKAYKKHLRNIYVQLNNSNIHLVNNIELYSCQVLDVLLSDVRAVNYLDSIYDLALVIGQEYYLANSLLDKGRDVLFNLEKHPSKLRTVSKLVTLIDDSYDTLLGYSEFIPSNYLLCFLFSAAKNKEDIKLWERKLNTITGETELDYLFEVIYRSPSKLGYLHDASKLLNLARISNKGNYLKVSFILQSLPISKEFNISSCTDTFIKILSLPEKEVKEFYWNIRRLEFDKGFTLKLTNELFKENKISLNELTRDKKILILKLCGNHLSEPHIREVLDSEPDAYNKVTLASLLGLNYYSRSLVRRINSKKEIYPNLIMGEVCEDNLEVYFEKLLEEFESFSSCQEVVKTGPLITVIITTYNPNVSLFILSIRSILSQIYKNIEIIIVDDCSKDEITSKLKIELSKLDFKGINYRLISNEKNIGQYRSRNKAIALSNGEYFAIQDDDDVSHPTRLYKQMSALNQGAIMSFAKHIRFNEDLSISIDDKKELTIFGDGPATLLCTTKYALQIGGFRDIRSRGDIDFRERMTQVFGARYIDLQEQPLYFMRASMSTISSVYEYFHGDKLNYYRDLMIKRPSAV
ncbi:glycosyltransferase family 2 protein [Vibrio sp. JC009]|uniref:glycosyltransferase family 2 protein n=1 Tax=Vibrio sp. JC009 TaxID=2912314 RepID=UPI0023B01299|nr:glycosyltransferase family 2 protein [Vibrio sp. JC009]WED24152.1 glycosyltransferase family 2 protein [Vibrio sp. JC009]